MGLIGGISGHVYGHLGVHSVGLSRSHGAVTISAYLTLIGVDCSTMASASLSHSAAISR
jgi:hypothetical protein